MTALIVLGLMWLAITGMPIFAVILAAALLGFHATDVDLAVLTIELYRLTNTPLLIALPFFTLAGYLLAEGNTSHRLVRVSQAVIGWLPSGLAIIAFITCALFTAFTGASGVTIVALGALLYPALRQVGYQEHFSLGLVTSSGSLGLLLAPSLPLILYGIVAQQMELGTPFTIKQLFLAGLLPAAVMIGLLSAWSLWVNRGAAIPIQPFSASELRLALWEARWELPLPLLILFGIYGGFFALTETATVTLLYVLLVQLFAYREVRLSQLPDIIRKAMTMVGGILLILGVSLAFTNLLIDADVPSRFFEFTQQYVDSRLSFLILLNVFLLILGAILDIFSAIIIVVPLILPLAVAFGIDPIHLGIIFLANMQIGYFTPPVGMNLFIASYRFNKPITTLYKASLPFMAVLMLAVLLITYIPWLSLGMAR